MVDMLIRAFLAALLSGLLVGVSSPLLTIARTLMAGLSMIHNVLAGGIIAIYFYYVHGISIPLFIMSVTYVILIALITAELIERGHSPDTAAGLTVAISSTITVLFGYLAVTKSSIAISRAWSLVVGTSAIITGFDILLLVCSTLLVISLVTIFRKEIIYIAFDEVGARAMGLNVRFYRYVLYIIIAIMAITLTMTIGIIVAHIIIVAPGALALQVTKRHYWIFSLITALIITIGGYFMAYVAYLPPSGGVGVLAATSLILSEVIKLWRK